MTPSIAVIVTCYNYEKFVKEAIESVLAQTRSANEIIVVDDGSTDGSSETILSYGSVLRVLIQDNAGHVAARNSGLAASTSDVVIFLDADDRLLPTALESVERAWTPTTVKVQFELEIIDAQGRNLRRLFCHFPAGYDATAVATSFRLTSTYIWPVMSGNAYSRRFVEALRETAPPQAQDGLLNTLAPLYGDVTTICSPKGQYRLHGLNVSRKTSQAVLAGCPDFPRRIEIRRLEFQILAVHAAQMAYALPPGDPLDRELTFINYRLISKKAGLHYTGSAADSVCVLWFRGVAVATQIFGVKGAVPHYAWLSALILSPRPLAHILTRLRFNRGDLGAHLRNRIRRAIGFDGVAQT